MNSILDDEHYNKLLNDLDNTDASVRWNAVYGLGRSKDTRVLRQLIWHLKNDEGVSPYGAIKEIAAWSLGQVGDSAAFEPLKELLNDERWWNFRYEAAKALGELKDSRVFDVLMERLAHEVEPDVIEGISIGLGYSGDKRAIKALGELLNDSHWWVRAAAARSLGKLGEDALLSVEKSLNDDDEDVRSAAEEAISNIKSKNR